MLYGGNTFGTTGFANGDCWLLDLDKAKKLANFNPDKVKEMIGIDLDRVKDLINLNEVKGAKDMINKDLDAEQVMDPTSIWTPVSKHLHLPRVQHRDDTFLAFQLLKAITN